MSISRSVAAGEGEHGLVAWLAAPLSMWTGSGLAGRFGGAGAVGAG